MPEHRLRATRAQDLAVIDAVSAEQHRVRQREHLAPRPRRARAVPELDGLLDQRLERKPPAEGDRQQQPGVGDRALVVEDNLESVRQIVHHAGDLLTQAAVAGIDSFLPAQEVISLPPPDGSRRRNGGSRLSVL